jgi:hypothetical protein
MPKERSREVRVQIRRVFNEVWDPIGVMKDPEWPRDEYNAYIGGMFELLTSNATDQEIDDYLCECAAYMGMDATKGRHVDVIEALRKISLD